MDWSDLKIFLAVARARTLSAAARTVGQTQPTIGRRLKALEDRLGQRLFHRGADGFTLTAEGMSVLVYAERMEEDAFAFERTLDGKKKTLRGNLRVASLDWFGLYHLSPLFSKYLRSFPDVSIELLTSDQLVTLSRREADLAFRITPFSEPDVIQKKIMHLPYALYGSSKLGRPKWGSGEGISLITLNMAYAEMPDVVWLQRHFPRAQVSFRSNSREMQAQMCNAGNGFAVLPILLGDRLRNARRIESKEAPPGRDVWMGYHRDLARLDRLKHLTELFTPRLTI